MNLEFTLNGQAVSLEIQPGEHLLDALRAAGCISVKRGCETGDCGACCVLLNGEPVNSCMVPAAKVADLSVTTLEGLREDSLMRRLQTIFIDAGAVQCGFCTPGILLVAWQRIRGGGSLNENDVRHALSGNLCRCTGYAKPVQAILDAWEDQS